MGFRNFPITGAVLAVGLSFANFASAQCQGHKGNNTGTNQGSSQRFGGPNTQTGFGPGTSSPQRNTNTGIQNPLAGGPGVQNPFGNPQQSFNNPLGVPPQMQFMLQQQQQQLIQQQVQLQQQYQQLQQQQQLIQQMQQSPATPNGLPQQAALRQALQNLASQQTTASLQAALGTADPLVRSVISAELSRRSSTDLSSLLSSQ